MDGYAVIAADTIGATRETPVTLPITERVFTGNTPIHGISRGECSEIATGAPLPDGCDAVVMFEETRRVDNEHVETLAAATPGQNIGRRGADITPGDLVVKNGDLLSPRRLGAVAAVGVAVVEVFAQPRVAILSTGNEVVEPGEPLSGGQIYDVNRFTLGAVVSAHGCIAEPHAPVRDTIEALEDALNACAGTD